MVRPYPGLLPLVHTTNRQKSLIATFRVFFRVVSRVACHIIRDVEDKRNECSIITKLSVKRSSDAVSDFPPTLQYPQSHNKGCVERRGLCCARVLYAVVSQPCAARAVDSRGWVRFYSLHERTPQTCSTAASSRRKALKFRLQRLD